MPPLDTIQKGRENKPPRLLIYGQEGVGKAQPLDARVLTPAGFVPMGEIQVGSEIIGSDGKPHKVLGIYPQGEKEVFRVTFRDGCSTECCDDHLWFTQTRGERDRKYPGSVRTLRTIRNSIRYGTHFNHAVPRVAPVEFKRNEPLPLKPWLLGIYLAEGCAGSCITNPEKDIQEKIIACIPEGDKGTVHEDDVKITKAVNSSNIHSRFRAALRALDLEDKISDSKFIPGKYLYSSVADRLDLLQGLCDGDGYVVKPGSVEICTASPQMAKDIMFLIRSLGGSAVCTVRTGKYRKDGELHIVKDSHRIYGVFTNGLVPVASKKQTGKWGAPEWMIRNTIRKVESVGMKVCQCIIIDALDSLYVTDDFILTHNSTIAAAAPNPIFVPTEDGLGEIDCAKFPLARSFSDVQSALTALRDEPHDFQTVVLDSADWLERLIWDQVCAEFGVRCIEKADGGFGKGYVHALTHWRKVVSLLDELRNKRGMIALIIAHSKVERFEDPENAAYDRYTPRLHKHAASLLSEWVDAVLFATRRFRIQKENAGFSGERGIAAPIGADGGERILRTVGSPACIAKNRFGLPSEIPLSWAAFIEAYGKAGASGAK